MISLTRFIRHGSPRRCPYAAPTGRERQQQQILEQLDCRVALICPKTPFVCLLLLLLYSACPSPAQGFRVHLLPENAAQATNEEKEGYFALMGEAMAAASKARSTPITEPGIPIEKVNGQWQVSVLKLQEKVIVGTYQLAPQYKFYVQASICKPDNKPAMFYDATFLGEHETAETFYKANSSFFGSDDPEYVLCVPEGIDLHSAVDPVHAGAKSVPMQSEERVLQYMSNWLLFLAKFDGDQRRSSDFLPFTLNRYRLLLLAANEEHDQKKVVSQIKFFDRTFPFAVFDQNITLSADGRAQARDFFQTMLFLCNKLKALSPDAASQIARAEALLKRFQ